MDLDLGNLTDAQIERMCQLCVNNEICYSPSTCEGSFCDRAVVYLEEELEDEEIERIEQLIEDKLGTKFKEISKQLGLCK